MRRVFCLVDATARTVTANPGIFAGTRDAIATIRATAPAAEELTCHNLVLNATRRPLDCRRVVGYRQR
jgi:hypothetical protein